jgi:hypothetical protein
VTAPAGPLVCQHSTLLPLQLLVGVLDLTAPGQTEATDVEETPECMLQLEHDGAHHALVLDGTETGAVWAVWRDGG